MKPAQAHPPPPAIGIPSPRAPARRAVRLLGHAFLHPGGGAALLVLLGTAYTIKRRLGIDVMPGVDMLPGERTEAAIRGVTGLLGG